MKLQAENLGVKDLLPSWRSPAGCLAFLATLAALTVVLLPNFIRARVTGPRTPICRSNLKTMGTAMEMYSTDNRGKYPTDPSLMPLTPNYLKTIPPCPWGSQRPYRVSMGPKAPINTQAYQDYYLFECVEPIHQSWGIPEGYPGYNGIVGLMDGRGH